MKSEFDMRTHAMAERFLIRKGCEIVDSNPLGGVFDLVAKTEEGGIVALGAYRVREGSVAVYIAYIESQPESNPTLTRQKKYQGIGKAMIAFGIQLSIDANCNGVVVFEAKTDELEQHYIRDFGARPVASLYPDGPKTFMIADQAAKDIFSSYLF